jgi:hypothetical protein
VWALCVLNVGKRILTNNEIGGYIKHPVFVYPHDCTKGSEVWLHLLRYCRLLNLHGYPVPGLSILTFQPSPVYLGNASTSNCCLLKLGKYTIRPTWRATEFFPENAGNVCKRDLRCIVEQP